LRYRILFGTLLLGVAPLLGGCGGGTATPQTSSTATPSSVTSSAPIAASGGSASATLGAETLTVTAPAGSLAAAATVKLTLESPSSVSSTFSGSRATNSRSIDSVPTGAVPIAAFIIDDGGVALEQPLQVTITGLAAPASGTSVFISGYNASAFDDVAAETYANGTYSTSANVHYPGITLASQTLYVLYSVPTAKAATPAATVTVAGPASVGAGAVGTYTASETTPNGFPFFGHTFVFGVSSPALGTIASSSSGGALTGAAIGGAGSVTATDAAVSTFTGSESVAVTSARPGVTGLSEQYVGTLTEVDANNAIAGGPGATPAPSQTPVSTTTSAKATVTVTSAADTADTTSAATAVTFTANETDAASLSTTSSTTTSNVAYQQQSNGTIDVRLLKTVADESTGVIYEHDYGTTNGLTTILPETAGTFTNDASETYEETDPGIGVTTSGQQVTTTTTINPNGSYSSTFLDPNDVTGTPVAATATENADFSAVLNYNSIDSEFQIDFAAPASGSITFTLIDPNYSLDNALTVPSYIPASATQPSLETDTITPNVPLAGTACTNASTYPTATSVTQAKTIVDSVFGTVETRTTTSYDLVGVGTVCTVLSDTVNSYYDYSNQEGPALIEGDASSTPLLTTTVSEALSLQTTNASQLQSVQRSTQSIAPATMPIAALAVHVQHIAHQRAMARLRAFTKHESSLLRGGLAK